jgi:diaminohydroxyphosphoribosylaminopyrimidine deaminase/5-amino-6-(5-phosphoribosylamino)uracil reductase
MLDTNLSENLDEQWMRRALDLAKQARLIAPPNPWVGCVIVKDGKILGEGFTQSPGNSHAEIQALKQAQEKSQGSTLYVTLEPYPHHGRTPPCTEAILKAGVTRVVIATMDPDDHVQGQGIKVLWQAGVQVSYGCLQEEASRLLEPYLFQRTFKRPFIIGKAAISVDGRIAALDGSSQWISTKEARIDAHRLRAESQAIIVGKQTALQDTPSLTVREVEPPPKPPLRVILTSDGKVPPLKSLSPTLIFSTVSCSNQVKRVQIRVKRRVYE